MRNGVNPILEAEADRMIRESLKNTTSHSEKKDILTPWKQKDRLSREVYARSGVVDRANRSGIFHRVANPTHPHLNSVVGPGHKTVRPSPDLSAGSTATFSLHQFIEDNKDG